MEVNHFLRLLKKGFLVTALLLFLVASIGPEGVLAAQYVDTAPYASAGGSASSGHSAFNYAYDNHYDADLNDGEIYLMALGHGWLGGSAWYDVLYDMRTDSIQINTTGTVQVDFTLFLKGEAKVQVWGMFSGTAQGRWTLTVKMAVWDDTTKAWAKQATTLWSEQDLLQDNGLREKTWNGNYDFNGNFQSVAGHSYVAYAIVEAYAYGGASLGEGLGFIDLSPTYGTDGYIDVTHITLTW